MKTLRTVQECGRWGEMVVGGNKKQPAHHPEDRWWNPGRIRASDELEFCPDERTWFLTLAPVSDELAFA
jgi:hypothetical protein